MFGSNCQLQLLTMKNAEEEYIIEFSHSVRCSQMPYDEAHKCFRLQLKNDHHQYWKGMCMEVEKAEVIGTSRKIYRLIRSPGLRKTSVSEVIK